MRLVMTAFIVALALAACGQQAPSRELPQQPVPLVDEEPVLQELNEELEELDRLDEELVELESILADLEI